MSQEVKMIKKDAKISIEVGAGFLHKLHELVTSLLAERSEEELLALKTAAENNLTELPEQWMENVVTVSSLISSIQDAAEKQGFTYVSTAKN
jgi:hypothetical protein